MYLIDVIMCDIICYGFNSLANITLKGTLGCLQFFPEDTSKKCHGAVWFA